MKESPFTHSSVNRPPSRNRLSAPDVAALKRASAPSRTASAPGADCTSAGLMMSGSVTSSRSSVEHAAVPSTLAAAASLAAARTRDHAKPTLVYAVMASILEAEGETERQVRRRSERLERRRRVTGRAERLRIDAGVLRPEDTEI